MWELDCEESWVPKNWCFWSVVLEKTLESPLDCKEIQPVHPINDIKDKLSKKYDELELEQAEIQIKYEGYIKKARKEAEKMRKLENKIGRASCRERV